MDKFITIKRRVGVFEQAQNEYNRKEGNKDVVSPIYEKALTYYTAKINSAGGINFGMPFDYAEKIYKDVTNVPNPSTKDMETFWQNQILVLRGGSLTLNIGMRENGLPINPREYIMYKIATTYDEIAPSAEDINDHHRAYIDDPNREETVRLERLAIEDKATREYQTRKADPAKLRMYLYILKGLGQTQLGKVDIKKLTDEQVVLKTSDIVKADPELFIKVVEDKEFESKYLAEKLIAEGLWKKERGLIYFDETVFESMEKAVDFLLSRGEYTTSKPAVQALKQQIEIKKK
jgi:hypothetical protein